MLSLVFLNFTVPLFTFNSPAKPLLLCPVRATVPVSFFVTVPEPFKSAEISISEPFVILKLPPSSTFTAPSSIFFAARFAAASFLIFKVTLLNAFSEASLPLSASEPVSALTVAPDTILANSTVPFVLTVPPDKESARVKV